MEENDNGSHEKQNVEKKIEQKKKQDGEGFKEEKQKLNNLTNWRNKTMPKQKSERKRWMSKIPENCDLCKASLKDGFVDGRIEGRSSWAIMCLSCLKAFGAGLGTGFGQQYDKEGFKVAG